MISGQLGAWCAGPPTRLILLAVPRGMRSDAHNARYPQLVPSDGPCGGAISGVGVSLSFPSSRSDSSLLPLLAILKAYSEVSSYRGYHPSLSGYLPVVITHHPDLSSPPVLLYLCLPAVSAFCLNSSTANQQGSSRRASGRQRPHLTPKPTNFFLIPTSGFRHTRKWLSASDNNTVKNFSQWSTPPNCRIWLSATVKGHKLCHAPTIAPSLWHPTSNLDFNMCIVSCLHQRRFDKLQLLSTATSFPIAHLPIHLSSPSATKTLSRYISEDMNHVQAQQTPFVPTKRCHFVQSSSSCRDA
ncbi:hypothetical protein LIA77_06456 [Sarocladium implicatum]|nr:hypothetical protein LIA77_06456 [Sarocladium implicatum]